MAALTDGILNRDGSAPGLQRKGAWRRLRAVLAECYSGSSWLTVVGLVMLASAVAALLGMVLDRAVVDGAPAWLKPLKFGISTGVFNLTVAYMINRMRRTRRFARFLGGVMAGALVPEIGLIDMQAARHTASHFNTATNFDQLVFAAMGLIVAVVYLATIVLFVTTLVERFEDSSLGWTIRLSLALAIAGMSVGAMMAMPTPQQLASRPPNHAMPRTGAHTVGAPDGGAGIPVTGWSADHGDLRVAHFIGLHGMQLMLVMWGLSLSRPFWSEGRRLGLAWLVALDLAAVMGLVLWQALRGQPLLKPDVATWQGWAGWLLLVAAGTMWVVPFGKTAKLKAGKLEEEQA